MENYRNQLSPFGRDVLDVMIRQWRKDRIAVNKRRFHQNALKPSDCTFPRDYTKKRRVLTFNNTENARNVFTDTGLLSHHDGKSIHTNDVTGLDKPSIICDDEDNEAPFEFEDNRPVALNAMPTSQQLIRPAIAPTMYPRPLMSPPFTDHSDKDMLSSTGRYLSHARNVVANLYKVGSEPEDDGVVERQATRTTMSEDNEHNKIQEVKGSMTLLHEELINTTTRCDDRNSETSDNLRHYELGELMDFNKMPLCDGKIPNDERKTEVKTHNLTQYRDDLIGKINTSKELENYADINNAQKNKNVDWNDMFDTEILSQADSLEDVTFDKIQKKEIQTNLSSNVSEVKLAAEGSTKVTSKGIQIISDEVIKPETLKKKNANKRKAQTKVTDKIPNKVKKIPRENKVAKETSFKKQSYKKTVSTWLETVEPCDAPESEENTASEIINDNATNKEVEKILTKYTESKLKDKSPKDKKKKVIQAQLANKDGVMKFKKPNPKPGGNENNKQVQDVIESSDAEVSHETKESTNSSDSTVTHKPKEPKGKKPKTKFVAPIKSQIPIKDITYDVEDLDEINLKEHLTNILDQKSEDITLVVTYKNGFCQLNCQHTDDSCVPEGLMLSTNDTFFYIKQTQFPDSDEISSEHVSPCGSLLEPDDPPQDFSALQALLSHRPEYRVESNCPRQRTAWCSTQLRATADKMRTVLRERELWPVFEDIEMKLVPIIANMERLGVCVDVDRLQEMEKCLLEQLKEAEAACHRAAGRPFQINSALQVRALLYDELQLHRQLPATQPVRGTGTGEKSTSEVTLRRLSALHALPRLVLQYRRVQQARAGVAGVARGVRGGRVRPAWTQSAATGRIACSGPNLQAIPKAPFTLQLFPEPGQAEQRTLNLRSVYIARAGHTLVAADYRHVECRVLAHVSGDPRLRAALAQHTDLFRALAARWLEKPAEAVSDEERERTKRVVYAKLYGAGTRRLAELLDMPLDRAAALSDSFSRAFPGVGSFSRAVVSRCAMCRGQLSTVCGRRRHFKHIDSADYTLRSHAERQAVNFVVQGSAADLCKLAMVSCAARMRAVGPPLRARLVLQLHDELLWELRERHLRSAADIIRDSMESCGRQCGMDVSLPVAISYGRSWGEMEPFHFDTKP